MKYKKEVKELANKYEELSGMRLYLRAINEISKDIKLGDCIVIKRNIT